MAIFTNCHTRLILCAPFVLVIFLGIIFANELNHVEPRSGGLAESPAHSPRRNIAGTRSIFAGTSRNLPSTRSALKDGHLLKSNLVHKRKTTGLTTAKPTKRIISRSKSTNKLLTNPKINKKSREEVAAVQKKQRRNVPIEGNNKESGRSLNGEQKMSDGRSDEKLQEVTMEVERLFDSLNKRRNNIDRLSNESDNDDEMTVVIQTDGGDDDDDDASHDDKRASIPSANEKAGFVIVLDNTDEPSNNPVTVKSSANDFKEMSLAYDKMSDKFESFLEKENSHIIRHGAPTLRALRLERRNNLMSPTKKDIHTTEAQRRQIIAKNTIETIDRLKQLRKNLEKQSKALDSSSKEDRSSIGREGSDGDKTDGRHSSRNEDISNNSKSSRASDDGGPREANHRENSDKETKERVDKKENSGTVKSNTEDSTKIEKAKHTEDRKPTSSNSNSEKTMNRTKVDQDKNTEENLPTINSSNTKEGTKRAKQEMGKHLAENRPTTSSRTKKVPVTMKGNKTFHMTTPGVTQTRANNNNTSASKKNLGEIIVHPRKAGAMIEYLNKDPLEAWFYKYQSLQTLGLNSTMLRNGLVNAGSIDRLKNVMDRALKGEDITLSVVGGSISAGGGLYKDEGNIAGLYYKGVVDWWNKVITPLTGSEMKVNNVAIGSIGTDYFSFCLRSHVWNDSNIVLWELSGNDYNRYLKTPTKGAKPLERLTRMALQLPRDPAIIYVNFFKGVDYKKTKKTCPNFEDQGEDIIAHYYKIPSLSWRAMVCESLIDNDPRFTLKTLFCKDQYHPSLLAHAQTALLLILHLRHVMRSVLQYASAHDGVIPNFASLYNLPAPLFIGLDSPSPLCWTLITPDFKGSISNTLGVKVLDENGFKLEYATNFPIRFDRVICWKAEKVGSVMKFQITLPEAKKGRSPNERKFEKFEIAITTHTRFGGAAEVWLDQRPNNPMVIREGRPNDTGKRTQVDVITQQAEPGVHTLNLKAIKEGFCLTTIMVS